MAAAATTIAAPLWFYADKATDVVTAGEFMKEAKATWPLRLMPSVSGSSYSLAVFEGPYNTGGTRSEPDHDNETWEGFQACFAEEFCVPVNKAGNFDVSEVQ